VEEEAGLVIEGIMKLTVDAESWTRKQGDSFRFASRRPHQFSNPSGDSKAVVLWVNCLGGVLKSAESPSSGGAMRRPDDGR
jgi:quercetin dioxygenase-like cupin family protein